MRLAIYDLGVAPVTFDICHFIMAAKRDGADTVDIWPGPHLGFRDDERYMGQTQADKESRLENIILPCIRLAGMGVVLRTERPRPELIQTPCDLRDAINAGLPPSGRVYSAPTAAKEWVSKWLRARNFPQNPVVVCLRNSIYAPRNSDEEAWNDFATEENAVVVPDVGEACRGLREFDGINLGRRLALYETASLVMGIGAGYMEFVWQSNHIPYLTWIPYYSGWPATTPEFMEKQGLPFGSQFPWSTPNQKLVWDRDSFTSICREFKEWKSRFSS